jgi:hypothetical protein
MDEWMNGSMDEWINGSMDEWVDPSMDEWILGEDNKKFKKIANCETVCR